MEANSILQPMIVLGILTLLVTVTMYITRVGAMKRLRIHPQKGQDTAKLKDLLPCEVSRISNNYNHLFEQPTLFYALVIAIAISGYNDQLHVLCAWAYVVLRIAHTLVQTTIDHVMTRFSIFLLSWLVLAVMLLRMAYSLFS